MNLSILLLKIKYISYIFTIIFFYFLIFLYVKCFCSTRRKKNKAGVTIYNLVFQPAARSCICEFCVTL